MSTAFAVRWRIRPLRGGWSLTALVLLLFGAFLRLVQLGSHPGFDWDESVYTDIGSHLAHGNVLQAKTDYAAQPEPYLYHPPFYYLVLAGWFRLFGSGIVQARYLAAISSVALLAVLYGFLRKLIGNWALLAMGMVAFDGWLVFTNRVGWIENFMMPLGVASLWLYWRAMQRDSLHSYALCGAALGGVIVLKHVGAFFLLTAIVHMMLSRSGWRRFYAMAGSALAVIVAYTGGMALRYPHAYWRESYHQLKRVLGIQSSRGAVTSFNSLSPLLHQYAIFGVTVILTLLGVALVVVRTVQAARQRSWRVISERHSLLYAWALSATVFFAAMQLRLPHYFALVVVPMYCYLAAEAKTFAEARQRHGQQFGGGQRMAMVALLLAFVGINLAASGVRLYGNGGNAIARTVAWTDAHLQPGTRVITEEPVGVAIHQPYCKIWRATICAHDGAKIIITYTSWTQHLPDDPALRALLANSEPVFTTAGFKERITVWRIDPALANGP